MEGMLVHRVFKVELLDRLRSQEFTVTYTSPRLTWGYRTSQHQPSVAHIRRRLYRTCSAGFKYAINENLSLVAGRQGCVNTRCGDCERLIRIFLDCHHRKDTVANTPRVPRHMRSKNKLSAAKIVCSTMATARQLSRIGVSCKTRPRPWHCTPPSNKKEAEKEKTQQEHSAK